ncbi:hypothetical protein GCM10027446_35140 [Angustibacter peucedani]
MRPVRAGVATSSSTSSATSSATSSTTSPPSTSPTAAARLTDAEAGALAAVLAAEQAAVYAYGVVGGQGDDDRRALAQAALLQHATRRDLLAGRLSAAGRTPPPAAPAYGTGWRPARAGARRPVAGSAR